MNDHSARLARAYRYPSSAALFPRALWLRAGLVGLFAAAGGVATLADGSVAVGTALSWLVAGAALAAYSWRRVVGATAALDMANGDETTAPLRHAPGKNVRLAAGHRAT